MICHKLIRLYFRRLSKTDFTRIRRVVYQQPNEALHFNHFAWWFEGMNGNLFK